MYSTTFVCITLGMRTLLRSSINHFKETFRQLVPCEWVTELLANLPSRVGRKPTFTVSDLVMSLVFHVLQFKGSLSDHVNDLTGQTMSDSAISQRRTRLSWEVFRAIMARVLQPKADPDKHPDCFYKGYRLIGVDGTQFSVSNTPQIDSLLTKSMSRRLKAAFAKVGAVVLVELGMRNPIAAAIARNQESEMTLAEEVLVSLPDQCLLIADRYYGHGSFIDTLLGLPAPGSKKFLLRVKKSLKVKILEHLPDGSQRVEVHYADRVFKVRQIIGSVGRKGGKLTEVRFWTNLLDWVAYPALELLKLYSRRWEQESFYRELKVDMRSATLLRSHTPETAAQEIAALVLGYSILAQERIDAAAQGQIPVLRVSFIKTLTVMSSMWQFLLIAEDILSTQQVDDIVRAAIEKIICRAVSPRRKRSCLRAIRQPVSSWPRLIAPVYDYGDFDFTVLSPQFSA